MNTKQFIVLLLVLFCGKGAMAQIDVTDRISDPDFEQEGKSEWKTNGFGRQGNNTFPLKHGDYYRETWSGGTEISYSGIYVPINDVAIAAYLSAGRYDNFMKSEQTTAQLMTIGFKQTQKVANDQLVIDGFKLFYYGAPGKTGIEDLSSTVSSHEVEGYYNLNGVRISKPARGITIVKYKDGRSLKVKN